MTKKSITVSLAIAGALAGALASLPSPVSADDSKEKCYGVALKG